MTRREAIQSGLGLTMAPGALPQGRSPGKPNILLLMADQMRGDCLRADGNRAIRTPHLDALSNEGARFRCAYSSTPSCTPARSALLTGLSPWHHGMLGYGRVGEKYASEMPRLLHDGGYYTAVIGKCHFHPQRNTHGFDHALLDESGRVENLDFRSDYRSWFWSVAPDENPDKTGIGWNDYRAATYALPEEMHPTHWTGETAVRFLRNYRRAEPFFLKVSFARPHSPYDAPARFMDMYKSADLPQAEAGAWAKRWAPRSDASYNIWHGDLGRDQVRSSRQGYYGNISFIDEQIGRILETLHATGKLEQTLILFLSDHGDMTGDQNLWRKSYAYEPSARIPMIVRWPQGLVSAKRGQVLNQAVEIRDVLPTFLDAAGVQEQKAGFDGRSLLSLIRNPKSEWREWIDLEHDICYGPDNHWSALTDGRTKYIFHARDGEEQLFDLTSDPAEMNDLAQDTSHSQSLRLWRQKLIDYLSERGDRFVKGGKLALRPESYLYSPNYPACSCHPRQRSA